MEIKLPKDETVELKEFLLKQDFIEGPFFHSGAYSNAVTQREKDILTYLDATVGKKRYQMDYPDRTNFRLHNTGERIFLRVSRGYYSPDNSRRILISEQWDDPVIYAVFQKAKETTSEQRKTK